MLRSFDDGRLFGQVLGPRTPEVLALHGWGRTHRDFDTVLGPVGDAPPAFSSLALDLPGFGASPVPPQVWGPAEYAQAVAPVLDQLSTPAVLLGHSFGGRVAVHLASSHPDQVRGLVITGAPVLARPGRRRRPPLGFRVARQLHRMGLYGEARMEAARQRHGSADYRAAQGILRQVLVRSVGTDDAAQLRAIRCPVVLVWGDDDDDAVLAVAESARDLLGEATLIVCPGAGHFTPRTVPGTLRAAVEGLLA